MLTIEVNSRFFKLYNGVDHVVKIQNNNGIDIFTKVKLYLECKNISKKISDTNNELKKNLDLLISSFKNESIENIKSEHTSLKSKLDYFISNHQNKFSGYWFTKSLDKPVKELVSTLKEVEMHLRANAYPERNEVLLTYDELKELSEAFSGWDCPSEFENSLEEVV